MKKLSKKAVGIIRAIQKRMERNPTCFDMGVVVETVNDSGKLRGSVRLTDELVPPCGTVACIAGWTLLEAKTTDIPIRQTMDVAGRILGLDPDHTLYGWAQPYSYVFMSEEWPEPFRVADLMLIKRLISLALSDPNNLPALGKVIEARTQLASKRLDYLVATGL